MSILPRDQLRSFIRESNRIEGILRDPTAGEEDQTAAFLGLAAPSVSDVATLVAVYQFDAVIRDQPHLNVSVGGHIAPRGGPEIVEALADILSRLPTANPWALHVEYETLHPFTDGNGRSGRALWAWQIVRRQGGLPLGFLHQFYYQTLASVRLPDPSSDGGA